MYLTIYAVENGKKYGALLTRTNTVSATSVITLLSQIINNYNYEGYSRHTMNHALAYKILSCYSERHGAYVAFSPAKPTPTKRTMEMMTDKDSPSDMTDLEKILRHKMFSWHRSDRSDLEYTGDRSRNTFNKKICLSVSEQEMDLWNGKKSIFIDFTNKQIMNLDSIVGWHDCTDAEDIRELKIQAHMVGISDRVLKCISDPESTRISENKYKEFSRVWSILGCVPFNELDSVDDFIRMLPCTIGAPNDKTAHANDILCSEVRFWSQDFIGTDYI